MRSYHVAPRHSAGSPALVDEATAMKVAVDELCLAFVESVEAEREEMNIQGIVYSTEEHHNKIYLLDHMTRETFVIPAKDWAGKYWYARTDRNTFLVRN